jgi:hypothetical protein
VVEYQLFPFFVWGLSLTLLTNWNVERYFDSTDFLIGEVGGG